MESTKKKARSDISRFATQHRCRYFTHRYSADTQHSNSSRNDLPVIHQYRQRLWPRAAVLRV